MALRKIVIYKLRSSDGKWVRRLVDKILVSSLKMYVFTKSQSSMLGPASASRAASRGYRL